MERKCERLNLRTQLEERRKLMPVEMVEECLLVVFTIGSYEEGGVIYDRRCKVEVSRVVVDNSLLAITGKVLSEPKL